TGRRVQCVCRCHRTSACARSGKVRLGQDSSSYRMLNSRMVTGISAPAREAVSASAYRRSPSTDSFRLASILAR
ncbi:Zinc/cadmium/mercury/lead-transporting ATPase, partial [Dysosmobacter welbionis]